MTIKTIIALNQTVGDITLEDIGIIVPGSGNYDLTSTLFVYEIQESFDLFTAIQNDEILINDGYVTLSKEDSLLAITPPGEEDISQNTDDITSLNNSLDGYVTVIDDHIADLNNPHQTSIANIGSGTLADLNSVITDATLDDASDSRTPTAHASTHESGGSDTIEVSNLGTSETDTTLVLRPDGYGGIDWVIEASAPVTSVFGRTGPVVAEASDYDSSQIDNDSTVSGVFVSDALDSLQADLDSLNNSLDGYVMVFEDHIADLNNPHQTSIANIGSGTLADLNSVITDATLDDSSDPRTPTAHASTHENGGSDEIELANMGTSEVDTSLVLKPDGVGGVDWVSETLGLAPPLSEVLAEGNTTDGYDIVVVDGDEITGSGANPQVTIQGTKYYPASATDPTTPTPATGDIYYNTVLEEEMRYDGTRAKWLSTNAYTVQAGRNFNTGPGVFYRAINGMVLDNSDRGIPVQKGTLIYLGLSRTDADAATLDVGVNGASIATLATSSTGLTEDASVNSDFDSGLITFSNQAGSNTTSNVQIFAVYKKRV